MDLFWEKYNNLFGVLTVGMGTLGGGLWLALSRETKQALNQAQSLVQKVFLFLQHISLWLHPSTLQ